MVRTSATDWCDELTLVSGNPSRAAQFTLTCLVRNEMHFLPVFLPHYRRLGVDRFVVLDDKSNDGTAEFVAGQDDVVLLRSKRRYGDPANSTAGDRFVPGSRMETVWRHQLQQTYALDQWALHLDADEFLDLPAGMTLSDLRDVAEAEKVDAIWAVMMDVYPARYSDLAKVQRDNVIDPDAAWYFDAVPHLSLRKGRAPGTIYAGSRARLLQRYGIHPRSTWFSRAVGARLGLKPPKHNVIRKPVFVRWRSGAMMKNSHSINLPASHKVLLPLRHFKFNAMTLAQAEIAIAEGAHFKGSAEYHALHRLMHLMAQKDDVFGYAKSRPCDGYAGFKEAGVARGL